MGREPFIVRVVRLVVVLLACMPAWLVACSEASQKTRCNPSSQGCRCESYSSASDDSDDPALSAACAESAALAMCCADPGWPTVMTSCTCYKVGCASESSRFCNCYPGFGDPNQKCFKGGGLTDTQASVGICCRTKGGCHCSDDTTCSSSEVEVPSCNPSDIPLTCDSGSRVADCRAPVAGGSGGSGASGSSSSSSSGKTTTCPGSGYVSCTSPSDCPCGLTCARLATNETERYCTESCSSDQECAASTKWKLSTCNTRTQTCLP